MLVVKSVGLEGKRQTQSFKEKLECPQLGKAVNCILNCAFLDLMPRNRFNQQKVEQLQSHNLRRTSPWLIIGEIITNLSSHFDISTTKTALNFKL